MTIKLYHCRDARSLRPLWTLEELGLDYELVNMDFPPRFKHEGYLEVNPLGTVPTLLDGETYMTESSGMAQYLVERFGPTSLSVERDDPEFGAYLNWLYRSDATLTFPQTLILRYSMFEPEDRRQPQVAQDYTQWFLSRARAIESALEDREYLCAGRFTIADICVGYALYLARSIKIDVHLGPQTRAYIDRIHDRPAFHRCLEKQAELPEVY